MRLFESSGVKLGVFSIGDGNLSNQPELQGCQVPFHISRGNRGFSRVTALEKGLISC